jgi:hypothetical protein
MTNVTLYFRAAKNLILADYFDLQVPASYDETEELWGDGVNYVLPPGYSVGTNIYGELHVYDPKERECEIVRHPSGRPQLISAMPNMPVLKRAEG